MEIRYGTKLSGELELTFLEVSLPLMMAAFYWQVILTPGLQVTKVKTVVVATTTG